MKKFHFLDGLKIGGIENQALTLSSEGDKNEENYLVNLNKKINEYSNKFFSQNKYKNLKIISFQRKENVFICLMVFKIIKKYKPKNIIIYFNNVNSLWVVLGAKLAGNHNIAICIQNAAKSLSLKNFKTIILLKTYNKLNVKLIPCSRAILSSYLNIDNKIKFGPIIPNCISKKHLQKEIKIIKKNKKLNKIKNVLMIARLDKIKDQETLIKAYSKLKNKCNLFLVGDGQKRKRLEQLSIELDLDPKKIFLGSRLDIPKLLSLADIFAFSTTEDEGFGIVLIEAMAAGLPIIATDVSACREVLDDGNAGILVPPGRVDIWIKEIKRLINSDKEMSFYEKKSFQNIEKYDVIKVKKLWENVF